MEQAVWPSRYVVRRPLIESDGSHDLMVEEIVQAVNADMRGQPVHLVYEMLSTRIRRRLPGVAVDEGSLRTAAARISFGLLPA
jgi:hypothetical protein